MTHLACAQTAAAHHPALTWHSVAVKNHASSELLNELPNQFLKELLNEFVNEVLIEARILIRAAHSESPLNEFPNELMDELLNKLPERAP